MTRLLPGIRLEIATLSEPVQKDCYMVAGLGWAGQSPRSVAECSDLPIRWTGRLDEHWRRCGTVKQAPKE